MRPQVSTLEITTRPAVRAWAALRRANATAARALSTSLEAEHGLTLNDYETLHALAEADGRRLKRVDLARRLVLTPSGVTRLLEGLEAAGLVERATCETDLRVTYAQLTDAGADRLEAASCAHEGSIRGLFDGRVCDDELVALAETLEQLCGLGGDASSGAASRRRSVCSAAAFDS